MLLDVHLASFFVCIIFYTQKDLAFLCSFGSSQLVVVHFWLRFPSQHMRRKSCLWLFFFFFPVPQAAKIIKCLVFCLDRHLYHQSRGLLALGCFDDLTCGKLFLGHRISYLVLAAWPRKAE